METKIQLKHPQGKKAIKMDKSKYTLLRSSILNALKSNGPSTHKEILNLISKQFKKEKTKFEGSLEWHMEWVKLDLEARKELKRAADTKPILFIA